MTTIVSFKSDLLEEIAKELGERVSGSELSRVFTDLGLSDDSGESTKWKRVFHVLAHAQCRDGNGARVAVFIERV